MSIQYTVLGFEPTTLKRRVSSNNHQTRASALGLYLFICQIYLQNRLSSFGSIPAIFVNFSPFRPVYFILTGIELGSLEFTDYQITQNISGCFYIKWDKPGLSFIFVSFQMTNIAQILKRSWCAWGLNLGRPDGRRIRIN